VSSAVAAEIAELGVTKGSVVLLITGHGSLNVVALLSILKLGACFIPIDRRRWSQDSINYVYKTVDNPFVVNTTPEPFAPPTGGCRMLHIKALPASKSKLDKFSPARQSHIQPDDTACIIFTSGSTGRPKGVMISHKSLCLYAKTSPVNMDISPGDRLLHILSVGFDGM
jgi:acyl-CoA synthetase (AMP-forming)/AMP-acid ligase II